MSQVTALLDEIIAKHHKLENPSEVCVGLVILFDLNNPFLVKLLPFDKEKVQRQIEDLKRPSLLSSPDEPPVIRIEYKPKGTPTDWEVGLIHKPRYGATIKLAAVALHPLLAEVVRNDKITYKFCIASNCW